MDALQRLREEVLEANVGIFRAGLVTMHSGNASGINRELGRVVIKPSGMDYEKLTAEHMVVTDMQGKTVSTGTLADQLKPSVDLPHHLYLYCHCTDVGGIVHTHSNYATSFAVLNRSIPVCLTAIADEFGGDIPCAPYVDNVGDHIGEAILSHRGKSPAVLLANHGVFAFGKDVKAALKTAVMLEDVAKTCHLASQLGAPNVLPAEEVSKWYERYHSTYGQSKE
jgi:L-ribulose-5-phosphate 4-epimerase